MGNLIHLTGNVTAQPESNRISGTALMYGDTGHPHGVALPITVAANAFNTTLDESLSHQTRDPLLLVGHDVTQPLARVANGSLQITNRDDRLSWVAYLDPSDPACVSALAKVHSGVYASCSVGITILKAERERIVDVSPEATSDKPVQMLKILEARLNEISLVAHGAFTSATTAASVKDVSDEEIEKVVTVAQALNADKVSLRINGAERVWDWTSTQEAMPMPWDDDEEAMPGNKKKRMMPHDEDEDMMPPYKKNKMMPEHDEDEDTMMPGHRRKRMAHDFVTGIKMAEETGSVEEYEGTENVTAEPDSSETATAAYRPMIFSLNPATS